MRTCSTPGPRSTRALGSLWALTTANARYWPGVAPEVRRELARWDAPARAIGDAALRRLAIEKLERESFNAEVAATLATLAPRRSRVGVARAIVALELLFDYLDGRTERLGCDPLDESLRLFAPFLSAVGEPHDDPSAASRESFDEEPDAPYVRALSRRTREHLLALPGAAAIAGVAHESARRCAQAQTRLHATGVLGEGQLREWALERALDSGLGWREYVAGCASSVLAVHALIAAAAGSIDEAAARAIDEAYLAIGALITILDGLVDRREDLERGQPGFVALYAPDELERVASRLTHEAAERSARAPNGDHHLMTLAGVVAYYTTHPGARDGRAREVAREVRSVMTPTVWPALGVMRCWRAARLARRHVRRSRGATHDVE